MDKKTEYKQLYKELSIEWYYIEDLNKELIQKTIQLLEMYMDKTKNEEEHQTTKYVHDCLCIYLNFDLCPIELTRIIKIMQMFFNLKCRFMNLLKLPNTNTNIDKHRKEERTRNLNNEIAKIERFNEETKQEIKALEHKMLGLRGIKTDEVRLENTTYNENRVLNIMENIDYLKQDIAYKNELIEHLRNIINKNKNVL